MNTPGSPVPSILLGIIGAALVIASAATDLLGWGDPGFGMSQVAGITAGLALIAAGHGLARWSAGSLGVRDVPWILGVLSVLLAVGALWGTARTAPPLPEDWDPLVWSIGERLLEVERSTRAARRGAERCYPPAALEPASFAVSPVVSGLSKPVYVTTAGDGSRRLFVVEKGGTIRIVEGGSLRDDPFLDISERVVSDARPGASWEQGLFSVAFPPDFAERGRFYIHYTAVPDGTVTISRFRVSDDPNRADPDSEETLLAISTIGPIHNGGQLEFGPDGYLYVAVGDGGGHRWPSGGAGTYGTGAVEYVDGDPIVPPGSGFTEGDIEKDDPWNQAQSLRTLRGKILRIDVGGDSSYTIPADNPFADDDERTRGEIWAYGLRNPWRFSFDSCDGALFAGDVGRSRYEEVDLIEPGANYGWKVMEGGHCFPPWRPQRCSSAGLEFPIAEYGHLDVDPAGGSAVVGGYVYRGRRLPSLTGRYVFGDFLSKRIWALTPTERANSGWRVDELMTLDFLPSSFGLDHDGELLIVGYDGTVYRLVASGRP